MSEMADRTLAMTTADRRDLDLHEAVTVSASGPRLGVRTARVTRSCLRAFIALMQRSNRWFDKPGGGPD